MSDQINRINLIVREHLGLGPNLNPGDRFIDDLGADSLDMVELAMALEEEFGIDINNEECDKLETMAELYALVESKDSAS